MVGHISLIGYTQGITLLINLFFGPALNAAYSIANQATNIINQFSSSFQTAINPQITKNYATKQYKEMNKLIYRSSKLSYFLMLILAVPLFYEANFLLKIWLGNIPEHSVSFMKLGIFIAMLTAVRNPLVTAAIANGTFKKIPISCKWNINNGCPTSLYCIQIRSYSRMGKYYFINSHVFCSTGKCLYATRKVF